jgi:hypothetical protein
MVFYNLLDSESSRNRPLLGLSESLQKNQILRKGKRDPCDNEKQHKGRWGRCASVISRAGNQTRPGGSNCTPATSTLKKRQNSRASDPVKTKEEEQIAHMRSKN